MTSERSSAQEDERAEIRFRQWARRLALQALYQWDVSGGDVAGILKQFAGKEDLQLADAAYFKQLVRGVVEHGEELDRQLTPVLDRPLALLDPVERTVLRFACFELQHCQDVPTAVILAEATRLASKFGTQNGSRYVNAVLDRAADKLRKRAD